MASDSISEQESEVDASDWEIEDGLPQFSDQFIQQYLQGREALIEQEHSHRSDYAFRQSLTPLAKEACAIVARIRTEEHRTIWTSDYDLNVAHPTDIGYFPGMMFALAKNRIEKTRSWEILRRMPKGALLHCHFDAMIDVDWLVEQALNTNGMVMLSDRPLTTAEAQREATVMFQYSGTTNNDSRSIWTDKYEARTVQSIREAADNYPQGATAGFRAWLGSKMTITLEESLSHHHGVDDVWQKFTSCFRLIGSILFYEPILRAALQRLLPELLEDGIRWVEFRCAFVFDFRLSGSPSPTKDYRDFFRIFGEEVTNFQATDVGRSFWGAKFIWTTLRMHDKKSIVQSMKDCIAVKKAHPDLVAGFDLVGQEDLGRPLADITPELFWFRKRCLEEGVNIPFFFHAGECLGDGDATDHNLFDAILLGTRRIGHGFSLYKHPLLVEMVKQKKILIESCPISNEVLRLTSSIRAHPLPALLARGVTAALCNDDPAVLGHGRNGMTHDFWQALQGWENLGLAGLASLAENSVRYAAYGPDQPTQEWNKDIQDGFYGQGIRAERLREWKSEWNKFCEWILLEFAAEYGSDEG